MIKMTAKTLFSTVRTFWYNYSNEKTAVLGLIIVAFTVFIAIFAPVIAPKGPFEMSINLFMPPSLKYPMGTDNMGRNIFNQMIWGTRVSLLFGVGAASISFFVGLTLGALAGYHGGVIDDLLSRIFEFFLLIPMLFLTLLLIALFGNNIILAMIVVGITSWPSNARLMRAQVLSIKTRGYVLAAIGAGVGRNTILVRHILPNAIQPVIVNTSFMVGRAIIMEAGLSFLGLGDPNLMSWGQVLQVARNHLSLSPWMAIFPGLALILLVWALYSIGDGINSALNPTLRER